MSNTGLINYSSYNYETIMTEVLRVLQLKQGPQADFSEGSYGRTILELMASMTDLNNHWVNSAFRESFLESAKNSQSVYALARLLGYSIRRPVPSKVNFTIALNKTGVGRVINVDIPSGTKFTFAGITLTLTNTVRFTYNVLRDGNDTGIMSVVKSLNGKELNYLLEGEFRTRSYFSNSNEFQEFLLDDLSASDYFGDSDLNWDESVGANDYNFCTVVTNDVDGGSRKYWDISRRGFSKTTYAQMQSDKNYTVKMDTNNEGYLRLSFGDGIVSEIPSGTISLKYFATSGLSGRRSNVVGQALTISSTTGIKITNENGEESDLTINDMSFLLTSDVIGGLDIESIDSIKNNASSVYITLDKLSDKNSYESFLKRNYGIRHASVYGESQLNKRFSKGIANVKYMNVVRYSLLKDLYKVTSGRYYMVPEDEYHVDGFKIPGLTYLWEYDYTEPTSSDSSVFYSYMRPEDFIIPGSELDTIQTALNRRGLLTVEHAYQPPYVHHIDVKISARTKGSLERTNVKDLIEQAIYKYLYENLTMSPEIYRSQIAAIVMNSVNSVVSCDVNFVPSDVSPIELGELNEYGFMASKTLRYVTNPFNILSNGQINTKMDFNYLLNGVSSQSSIILTDISDVQTEINNKILSVVYDRITLLPKQNVSVADLNDISAFIWNKCFTKLLNNNLNGELKFALRTWEINSLSTVNSNRLTFAGTDAVTDLVEVSGNMYLYINYVLEYIKFVRNAIREYSAKFLIETNSNGCGGDLNSYTSDNEIVQIKVDVTEITNVS